MQKPTHYGSACMLIALGLQNSFDDAVHIVGVDSLHHAVVVSLCHGGIDGQAGQDGQVEL